MATQHIMDHTGDTTHTFNPKRATQVAEAEKRFKELVGQGFTAAEKTGPGTSKIVGEFNPTAEETVFFPRLVGG